jgi:chromosome segregation ATPase
LEKEYLSSMEKALQAVKNKESLVQKHKELVLEEAWSFVEAIESKLLEIEEKLKEKQQEKNRELENIKKADEENKELKSFLLRCHQQAKVFTEECQSLQGKISKLEGQNQSHDKQINILCSRINENNQLKERITNPEYIAKKTLLEKELKSVLEKMQRFEKVKEKFGKNFFSPAMQNEKDILKQSLQFHEMAKKNDIAIYGPLFQELVVIHGTNSSQIWQALVHTLGYHLFSFIATKASSWEEAIALQKKMWPNQVPPFFIFFQHCQASSEKNFFMEVVQAPAPVIEFLQKKIQILFHDDISEVLKQAQKKQQIIWHKKTVHLPWPATGGTIWPSIFENWNFPSKKDLQECLEGEKNYKILAEQEEKLQTEYAKMDNVEQTRYLEQKIKEYQEDLKNFQKELAENSFQIQKAEKELRRVQANKRELENTLEDKQSIFQANARFLERSSNELSNIERVLTLWQQNKEEKMQQKKEAKILALGKGDRPKRVRLPEIVTQERLQLQGRLESLQISSVSEEEFTSQNNLVKKLGNEIHEGTSHLNHLQNDVEKRFSQWHQEVSKKIQGISKAMAMLLSGIVQGVRVRVESLKDPSQAGLQIEIKRNSEDWHDLSQLSGGEKVLTVEALILSLHMQTDSPVHAIDECTQRLDIQFKAQAFEIVQTAVQEIEKSNRGGFSPQFLLIAPDTLGVEFNSEFYRYFKQIVLAPARVKKLD